MKFFGAATLFFSLLTSVTAIPNPEPVAIADAAKATKAPKVAAPPHIFWNQNSYDFVVQNEGTKNIATYNAAAKSAVAEAVRQHKASDQAQFMVRKGSHANGDGVVVPGGGGVPTGITGDWITIQAGEPGMSTTSCMHIALPVARGGRVDLKNGNSCMGKTAVIGSQQTGPTIQ